MKRLIVFVVLAALLTGCAFAEGQPTRYSIGDISVFVPSDFTIAENNAEVLTFKRAFGSRTLLFAIRDGENVTPQSAASLMKDSLGVGDFTYDVSASINGIPYVDCTFTNDNPFLFGKAALILDESTDTVYVICYTSIMKMDGTDLELWNLILGSIEAPTILSRENNAPIPESTPEPTPEPTAEPTPESTAEPTPESTAEPTPEPTPAPTLKRVERVTLRPIPTATPQPTLPPLDFKAVNRNPDNYVMNTYLITGTVVQSIETAELSDDKIYRTHLRVAVDGDHDQIILVLYNRPCTADRVLEDDRITFSAMCFGLTSYEALSGLTITLPYFGLTELYSIEAGD